ncbi:hypothetical protein DEU47_101741 [Bacillus sp. AG236]|nr:hypothetical protein DEU47_101741 [Bacillus sp. AG236]
MSIVFNKNIPHIILNLTHAPVGEKQGLHNLFHDIDTLTQMSEPDLSSGEWIKTIFFISLQRMNTRNNKLNDLCEHVHSTLDGLSDNERHSEMFF